MFVRKSTVVLSVIIFVLLVTCIGLIVHVVKSKDDNTSNSALQANESVTHPVAVTTTDSSAFSPWKDYRLPRNVLPLKYDLLLDPDLEKGTFTGRVNVTVDVSESRRYFLIHCYKDLNISASNVFGGNNKSVPVIRRFQYAPNEFYVLETEEEVQPGVYYLAYDFEGSLTKGIVGFYRSRYFDPVRQTKQYLATSKFQPTYARRAFPCFDEPSFKSNFTVSLIHPKGLVPLSNMPIHDQRDLDTSNSTLTIFQESVPMVTYLVCFIICDFKYTSEKISNGRELRVYSTPHQVENTRYSLQLAQNILTKYEDYFDIDYPLPKQDLIAIPDFVSGAMEHWGIITFRETNLLYSKNQTSPKLKQRVATVVAHELAHMWFGNLVTMKWWDDLWLNEGFASYFEYKGVDWAAPEWRMLDQFLTDDLQYVMKLDCESSSHPIIQKVNHPDEITEIFDAISYSKGASVLRMLEHFLNPENFRKGVSNFLKKYKYGNAQTDDLWRELSILNSLKTNKDVSFIMDTWTKQKGFPVVSVKIDESDPSKVLVTQEIFLKDRQQRIQDSSVWSIPLGYVTSFGDIGLEWLHDKTEKHISFNSAVPWVKFNNNQMGYYVTNYDRPSWNKFINLLSQNHEVLSPADRSNLIFDAFLLASAGDLEYDVPFDIAKYLEKETALTPWKTASGELLTVLKLLELTDASDLMKNYIQSLVTPIYNQLGWKESNDHLENLLREDILNLACKSGHEQCLQTSSEMFKNWIENQQEVQANVRRLVYGYGMSEIGTDAYWNLIWDKYLNDDSAQERTLLLFSLSRARRPHLIYRFLEYARNESLVRSQDFFTVLRYISSNTVGKPIVWDFVRSKWTELVDRFTLNDRYLGRMVKSVCSSFTTKFHLQEMKQFFEKYPEAGAGTRARLQALETVQNNIRWIGSYKRKIMDWLTILHSKKSANL